MTTKTFAISAILVASLMTSGSLSTPAHGDGKYDGKPIVVLAKQFDDCMSGHTSDLIADGLTGEKLSGIGRAKITFQKSITLKAGEKIVVICDIRGGTAYDWWSPTYGVKRVAEPVELSSKLDGPRPRSGGSLGRSFEYTSNGEGATLRFEFKDGEKASEAMWIYEIPVNKK